MTPNQAGCSPRILWAVMIGLAATAVSAPAELPAREPSQANTSEGIQSWLGMKLEDQAVRLPERRRFQVVVREVKPHGPAAKAGVQAGDVVVFVEDQLVSRTQDVVNILRLGGPDCAVSFDLLRAGRPVMATVTPVAR